MIKKSTRFKIAVPFIYLIIIVFFMLFIPFLCIMIAKTLCLMTGLAMVHDFYVALPVIGALIGLIIGIFLVPWVHFDIIDPYIVRLMNEEVGSAYPPPNRPTNI
jgi:hypothetical protein